MCSTGPPAGRSPAYTSRSATASGRTVATGTTDERGRIEGLASDLAPGPYEVVWHLGGFVASLSATLDLSEERPYHVPVLASGHSAVVYLGV